MLAIERTTKLFLASVKEVLPLAHVRVQKSKNDYGRSNYVYIDREQALPIKVRISDHPIGMRRALSGNEHLYIQAGANPASWAVWLGNLVHHYKTSVHGYS